MRGLSSTFILLSFLMAASFLMYSVPYVCAHSPLQEYVRARRDVIADNFPEGPVRSLFLGVVFGEGSTFDPSLKALLARTGVQHAVVASGSNVWLLVGLCHLVGRFFVRRSALLVGSLLLILGYLVLVGCTYPLARASLLLAFMLGGELAGRQRDRVHLLCISVLLMLLLSPEGIASLSFQLSVAATIGLMFCTPSFKGESLAATFFGPLIETGGVYLAIIPVLFLHGLALSPLGIVAAVPVAFLLPPVLGGGILLYSMYDILPAFSSVLIITITAFLQVFLQVLLFSDSLLSSTLITAPAVSAGVWLVYGLGLFLLMLFARTRLRTFNYRRH